MANFPQRIVFVDDDASIRKLARRILENYDPTLVLVTCATGQELLSRFRELQPDVVLLDLKMPGMTGPDVVETLRDKADGRDIPIIIVTGFPVEMTEEYKRLGVIGVIQKPFYAATLPAEIEAMWTAHKGPDAQSAIAENGVVDKVVKQGP